MTPLRSRVTACTAGVLLLSAAVVGCGGSDSEGDSGAADASQSADSTESTGPTGPTDSTEPTDSAAEGVDAGYVGTWTNDSEQGIDGTALRMEISEGGTVTNTADCSGSLKPSGNGYQAVLDCGTSTESFTFTLSEDGTTLYAQEEGDDSPEDWSRQQ